ncbi:uncharacterized protein LOC129591517 [Paramacrobiotus metropolitanus]|uniref:uncharacterized protein LOC129591517 n=1 Tax=Paramacrobiotus metropolitanus TaxID=2943436 RepID=UPI002445E949|nr:uncharacterized protein LOC129591517 [Paramacrobiotus metropolitanus]
MELVVLALTAWAFAIGLAAKTCEEQKTQCDNLGKDEDAYHQHLLPQKMSIPLWPVSEADVQQYRSAADLYCRWSTDLGNCRKSLYKSCPALHKNDKPSTGGWYSAGYAVAMGGLCNTTVGPVKFFRALNHCAGKDRSNFYACCNLDSFADEGKNEIGSVAHQNFCDKLKATVNRFDNHAARVVAGRCGQDPINTLKDGYRQLDTKYCKKCS